MLKLLLWHVFVVFIFSSWKSLRSSIVVVSMRVVQRELTEEIVHRQDSRLASERPPSGFIVIEKIGAGAFGSVFRVSKTGSGEEFAMKKLGPLRNWDADYQLMGQIKREILAYVRLKAETEVAHTAIFHHCFHGAFSSSISYFIDKHMTHCSEDSAVEAGMIWLQVGLEGGSLGSYMKNKEWRLDVMTGMANSPLPKVALTHAGKHHPVQLEILTKGRFGGLSVFQKWHNRFVYIGTDGVLYAAKTDEENNFNPKANLATVEAISNPAECKHMWCFRVGDRQLRAATKEIADTFIMKLRSAHQELVDYRGKVPFYEVRYIVRDMVLGLQELEKADLVHGDIKPDNLLAPIPPFLSNPSLRWTDFGFTADKRPFASNSDPAGATVAYGPPELLAAENVGNVKGSTFAYDMFAVGLLSFELLFGDKLTSCAVDDGSKDKDRLVLPPGYVQYSPRAYSNIKIMGVYQFQNMGILLQMLQVLGLPEDDPQTLLVQEKLGFKTPKKDPGKVPYGNPYDDTRNESRAARGQSQLWLERAVFSIHAAMSGEYAEQEERAVLNIPGLLEKDKYVGSKLVQCAEKLLAKHGLELHSDPWRAQGLELIARMLQIMPAERVTAGDALNHPWLSRLE